MNNIKKLGLTALAGSLVSLGSATAGEISVSGAINATLKFGKGGGNTSRTIGTDRDVAFSGSGELDNGTTFSVNTLLDDSYAVSAHTTTITTPSMERLRWELTMVLLHTNMMKKFHKLTSKYLMVNKLWLT